MVQAWLRLSLPGLGPPEISLRVVSWSLLVLPLLSFPEKKKIIFCCTRLSLRTPCSYMCLCWHPQIVPLEAQNKRDECGHDVGTDGFRRFQ